MDQSQGRADIDCREMDRGDVREETGGKCLWKKAGQPWKQGNTAESCRVGGAMTIASLSPDPALSAEQ